MKECKFCGRYQSYNVVYSWDGPIRDDCCTYCNKILNTNNKNKMDKKVEKMLNELFWDNTGSKINEDRIGDLVDKMFGMEENEAVETAEEVPTELSMTVSEVKKFIKLFQGTDVDEIMSKAMPLIMKIGPDTFFDLQKEMWKVIAVASNDKKMLKELDSLWTLNEIVDSIEEREKFDDITKIRI